MSLFSSKILREVPIRRFRLLFFYLLSEMIPTFFVGVISFISILLLFQVLKLTETLLQHSMSIRTLIHLLSYLSISFLPAIFPMSLVFAIVLSYNRFSSDSEIIALKSLGLSMWPIVMPGVSLGVAIAMVSGYTSFRVGPWGNRQFEVMINDIANSKEISIIGEGTFSGFSNLVVYANKVDKKSDEMEKVFIYDERNNDSPTTIIADRGRIITEKTFDSYKTMVRLTNGDIHKISPNSHTKIHFETYDLKIVEPTNRQVRGKSMNSFTDKDINQMIATTEDPIEKRPYIYEWHKRTALSAACLLFVIIGIGLGCRTNNRSGKSGGGVISVGVIVVYWVLFVIGNSFVKTPWMPVALAAWLPALVMTPWGFYLLRKNWN